MFFRSAVLLAVLVAATVAAAPDRVTLKAPALQSILTPGSPVRAKLLTMLGIGRWGGDRRVNRLRPIFRSPS
jgi:hypothetical protein